MTGVALDDVVRVVVTDSETPSTAEDLCVDRDGTAIRLVDRSTAPPVSGVISEPVALEDAATTASRAMAAWLADRTTAQDAVSARARSEAWMTELAEAGLDRTVHAHLRTGRRADRTATILGIHRNTLRARLAAADAVIGHPLDDPDVTAELWLLLRDRF